jgi:hypothetical protein
MKVRDVLDPPDGQPRPEDLDGLLRAFFRAEQPKPWPSWQPPLEAGGRPIRVGRGTLSRSRWVLAASMLCLVSGSLWLSGRFTGAAAVGDPGGARIEAARREPGSNPKGAPSLPRLRIIKPPIKAQDEMPR